MKVMIVAPYFYPKIGGLEGYVLRLALSLVGRGVEVVVVCSGERDSEEFFKGVKVYRLKRLAKISNTPIHFNWSSKIKRIVEKERPDFINGHSPVPFISDVAARVAQKKGIPFVLTYHSANLYKERGFLKNFLIWIYKRFLEEGTLNISARIIGVSDYVGRQFSRFGNKFRVVYNALLGEETEDLDFAKKEQVVFIGNLDKSHFWKGLDLVLKSLRFFKGKLVVVGDGDFRGFYERLAERLGVLDRVDFVGWKVGREKREIIGSSLILAAYPRFGNDAFPSVVLEAWSNKTAVVGADIGVFRDFIEEGVDGFLVEPLNPFALGNFLNEAMKRKKDLEKTALNGNRKLKENFLWDVQVDKFLEVLNEIKV